MKDFLQHLVARDLASSPSLKPRRAAMYERAQPDNLPFRESESDASDESQVVAADKSLSLSTAFSSTFASPDAAGVSPHPMMSAIAARADVPPAPRVEQTRDPVSPSAKRERPDSPPGIIDSLNTSPRTPLVIQPSIKQKLPPNIIAHSEQLLAGAQTPSNSLTPMPLQPAKQPGLSTAPATTDAPRTIESRQGNLLAPTVPEVPVHHSIKPKEISMTPRAAHAQPLTLSEQEALSSNPRAVLTLRDENATLTPRIVAAPNTIPQSTSAHPEPSASVAPPAETVIRVHIGRIEVFVSTPPSPPARRIVENKPQVSLSDYLRSRSGGKA